MSIPDPNPDDTKPASAPPKRLARGLVSVGAIKTRFSRSACARRGLFHDALMTHWPYIVGRMEAEWSLPERLSFPSGQHTGGELVICVASGSVATLLQYKIPLMIEAINRHIGPGVVTSVRLRQGALPPVQPPPRPQPDPVLSADDEQHVQSAVHDICHTPLQEALSRLGRHILKSRSTS